jgi:hypothetical protein
MEAEEKSTCLPSGMDASFLASSTKIQTSRGLSINTLDFDFSST